MAAAGEENVFIKLAKDLTSMRISTIVAREIRGGEVPPEPAVMLWEIAKEFENCLTELSAKTILSSTDRDILSRIESGSAEIGRLYANVDQRARRSDLQSAPAIMKYQASLQASSKTGAVVAPEPWAALGSVDRNEFARLEHASRTLLSKPAAATVAPIIEDWAEEPPAEKPAPVEGAPASGALIPSTWPIVPERLSAPSGARSFAAGASPDSEYQEACRMLFRLEPDEAIVLRKIWEIGTDVVLMETVIQLDGDVISRVRHSHQADAALQASHRQLLESGLNNWHFMMDAVGKLIDIMEKLITRR